MPLQAATDATDYTFTITGNSTTLVGSSGDQYPVTFTMNLTTDNPGSPDAVTIVQSMVDVLNAAPGWANVTATRTHTRTEAITPDAT